ncbi:hypothetical protein LCGC14_2340250 [marine sediment metagenome]|uniref:Uncharacterized protein n=1 Tax=marine sediment metagenome TaxID=412755 RepID=A0A0F9CD13_9ZZZZ
MVGVSSYVAETVNITSNATVRDELRFDVAKSVKFHAGLETATGEALKLDKAGAATVMDWIDYATIADDQRVFLLS